MSTYTNRLQPTLQKPITMCCSVLSPEMVMHDDTYTSGRSENNIKCVMHDDLGQKNQTTWYIMPCHWLYEWFSQFHRCGTYSILSFQNLGQRVYHKKCRMWMIWGGICLMRELECNKGLLTMALISGADVSMPAFELQNDSFNIHHDIN